MEYLKYKLVEEEPGGDKAKGEDNSQGEIPDQGRGILHFHRLVEAAISQSIPE